MARIEQVFATSLYRAALPGAAAFNTELRKACLVIACDDEAGQHWSKKHNYSGYTSYASLNDLTVRAPEFDALCKRVEAHVKQFARALDFETGRKRLMLDSMWINVLDSRGIHTGHIHPHCAVSGTYYVAMPKGASAIRFEDPRLPLMMAAPARKERARPQNKSHVTVAPVTGTLLLWESWLRHEVPLNTARGQRISVSFNYS